MKYLKITFFLFIVTLCLSSIGVKADSVQTYLNITLPTFANTVTYGPETKTTDSKQYYKSFGAVDSLTSGDVNVQVRTKSYKGMTSFMTVAKNETKTWGESPYNSFSGSYSIIMKREKFALTTAQHRGTWFLDEIYVN